MDTVAEAAKLLSNAEMTLRHAHSIFECLFPKVTNDHGIIQECLKEADEIAVFLDKLEVSQTQRESDDQSSQSS